MRDRAIAIQIDSDVVASHALELAQHFRAYGFTDDVTVFKVEQASISVDVDAVAVPTDRDNNAKFKNFILDYFSGGKARFVHIIEGNVALLKDPTKYITAIEHTMDVLDYNVHFSTTTDPCNYVFKKFCPRLTVSMDDDAINGVLKLPHALSFTSHSNTAWTIYDFQKKPSMQMYNESFDIAMYTIIEYLARRRAEKDDGQLYYMNQYLSISDEIGVFKVNDICKENAKQEDFAKEDALFRSMNIDYAPDNNIDIVLDALYNKIQQKMAK